MTGALVRAAGIVVVLTLAGCIEPEATVVTNSETGRAVYPGIELESLTVTPGNGGRLVFEATAEGRTCEDLIIGVEEPDQDNAILVRTERSEVATCEAAQDTVLRSRIVLPNIAPGSYRITAPGLDVIEVTVPRG